MGHQSLTFALGLRRRRTVMLALRLHIVPVEGSPAVARGLWSPEKRSATLGGNWSAAQGWDICTDSPLEIWSPTTYEFTTFCFSSFFSFVFYFFIHLPNKSFSRDFNLCRLI